MESVTLRDQHVKNTSLNGEGADLATFLSRLLSSVIPRDLLLVSPTSASLPAHIFSYVETAKANLTLLQVADGENGGDGCLFAKGVACEQYNFIYITDLDSFPLTLLFSALRRGAICLWVVNTFTQTRLKAQLKALRRHTELHVAMLHLQGDTVLVIKLEDPFPRARPATKNVHI